MQLLQFWRRQGMRHENRAVVGRADPRRPPFSDPLELIDQPCTCASAIDLLQQRYVEAILTQRIQRFANRRERVLHVRRVRKSVGPTIIKKVVTARTAVLDVPGGDRKRTGRIQQAHT